MANKIQQPGMKSRCSNCGMHASYEKEKDTFFCHVCQASHRSCLRNVVHDNPKNRWRRPLFELKSPTCLRLWVIINLLWIMVSVRNLWDHEWIRRHYLRSSGSRPSLSEQAWETLAPHVSLLDVPQITRQEFLDRQSILAGVLAEAGVDAFITEPSASSRYYANVSSSYGLSERPFLVIIDKDGQFSYLAPKFELARIGGLEMVFKDKRVIEWHEEESPFEALKKSTGYEKVILDEHARYFIATGLQKAGIDVTPATDAIQSIRAVKSDTELAILRGINEFTIELVRSLAKFAKVGLTQGEILEAATSLFDKAGLKGGAWALVLLGDQASNPHGGSFGKVLKDHEFVLIDIGSSLHGYGSDVTRTFLPAGSTVSDELWDSWYTVYAAQSAAIALMKVNETCSLVDAASRKVITDSGYGEFYTHRLGHGLGLEVHEHPYLNGANSEKLKAGQVVTNEPGIYVTNAQARKIHLDSGFGIRLEDAVLVTPDGGVVLTGSRAKSPYEP